MPVDHQIKMLQKQAEFLTKEVPTNSGDCVNLNEKPFYVQVEELNEKNKRYVGTLSKKDFFHEYEMLLKEVSQAFWRLYLIV